MKMNYYGYENINTSFVLSIRKLAISLLKHLKYEEGLPFLVKDTEFNDRESQEEEFVDDFMSYLTEYQEFGRLVARYLGKKAYQVAMKGTYCAYQYEGFQKMMEYLSEHCFGLGSIDLNQESGELLVAALKDSLMKAMKQFVALKCIEVG